MKYFFPVGSCYVIDKVCTVTCKITSLQKTSSALCSWQKKGGFELFVCDCPESYLDLAIVAFLWDRPLINSISIQYAMIIKAFFPFAELAFRLLRVLPVTSQSLLHKPPAGFSVFGLVYLCLSRLAGFPGSPVPVINSPSIFLPLLLMEGVLEVMKCNREGILSRWCQNLVLYCTLVQADQDGFIGKRKLYRCLKVFSNLSVWKIHHLVHQRDNSSLFIESYRAMTSKSFRIFKLFNCRKMDFSCNEIKTLFLRSVICLLSIRKHENQKGVWSKTSSILSQLLETFS